MNLTRQQLKAETDAVLDAITHPVFVERMQEFRATPIDQRYEMAGTKMTPDVLSAQGVPMPADMRVSSRVFEEGKDGNRESVNIEEGRRIINLIHNAHPEKLEGLKSDYPDLYGDLANVLGGDPKLPGVLPDGYKWTPMPRIPPLIDPGSPGYKPPPRPKWGEGLDPRQAGKWACACGGAATACGGAGGGD
jgi:hypothetical protein